MFEVILNPDGSTTINVGSGSISIDDNFSSAETRDIVTAINLLWSTPEGQQFFASSLFVTGGLEFVSTRNILNLWGLLTQQQGSGSGGIVQLPDGITVTVTELSLFSSPFLAT